MGRDRGSELQIHNSNAQQNATNAITALLEAAGIDAKDLATAITALAEAKKISNERDEHNNKIYQEKELVYDDENAFIFRRGDTKKRIYYLRIYDETSRKPYVKSLETTDRIKAITKGRLLYQEIIGKIERGETINAPNHERLIAEYLKDQEKKITSIPKLGITPEVFRLKKYHIRNWEEYLRIENIYEKTIDKIDPRMSKNFGYWLLSKPKKDGTSRSRELINNAISEIKRMYKYAVNENYLSLDRIPVIERLGEQGDQAYKRDIFELEEYERYWKFLEYEYTRDKGIDETERARRIIFTKTWGILMNTGMRPKELLGLRINEIKPNPHIKDANERKKHVVIIVRADNSKTGKSRRVVAPVKRRIDSIRNAYLAMGIKHGPEDFLLISPTSKNRGAYTRQSLYNRLKETLDLCGLKDDMEKEGKTISLYSARHTYITWRLRFGGVPIHLLAKNTGTSVDKIEKTYGHIEVEKQAEEITKAQGKAIKMEVDFKSILDEDESREN